jgi:hypothetical protein
MNSLLARRTKVPAVALGCVLLLALNGSSVAQTTGAVNPDPGVDPSGKDAPLAGDCMPIGITVSGEVVFPLQCRDFIERLKAADRKAAASKESNVDASGKPAIGEKPVASEEKTAANKEETLGPENSKPVDASGKPAIGEKPVAPEEKTAANKEESLGPENSKPVDASGNPAIEEKPVATEEKTVANKKESLAPEDSKRAEKLVAKAPVENRNVRKPREQAAGPLGCTRFRTYDPGSETYRSYDGRRLSCHAVDRAAMAK